MWGEGDVFSYVHTNADTYRGQKRLELEFQVIGSPLIQMVGTETQVLCKSQFLTAEPSL